MSEGNNGLTAEELAALDAAAGEDKGLLEDWEYFTLYTKRGRPQDGLQVSGPFDGRMGAMGAKSVINVRKNGKIVRRRRVVTYGEFEVPPVDEQGYVIEDSQAHELLRWIADLGDPDNLEAYQSLSLEDIILKAKTVLEAEEE